MRYRIQLWSAVPGTNTQWRREVDLFFESDLPGYDLEETVTDLVNEVVKEPGEGSGHGQDDPYPAPKYALPDPTMPLKRGWKDPDANAKIKSHRQET